MNFEQARNDVLNWITGFVEKPHPALNGWPPCPFARRARANRAVDIQPGRIDPYTDLAHFDMGHYQVVVFVYDPKRWDAEEFLVQIRSVNSGFLIPRGLFALGDHPDHPEIVQGVQMNQGQWALAFLQHKADLEQHARDLVHRNYYHGWDENYLVDLFDQREDPRAAQND
jgi:hypothetical protein